MNRRHLWLVCLLAALVLGGILGGASLAVAQQGVGAGLPQRTPPPRTLAAYWPVFAGFTVVWIGIVAYYLSLSGRASRVSRGLDGVQTEDRG